MVITPSKMRRTDDHESADIAIRRDVANFGQTAGTYEAVALEI